MTLAEIVARLYGAGLTGAQVAARVERSPVRVYQLLAAAGVARRPPGPFPSAPAALAADIYRAGMSLAEVGALLGMTKQRVGVVLRRDGVTRRRRGRPGKGSRRAAPGPVPACLECSLGAPSRVRRHPELPYHVCGRCGWIGGLDGVSLDDAVVTHLVRRAIQGERTSHRAPAPLPGGRRAGLVPEEEGVV